jgi:hypothetical protein
MKHAIQIALCIFALLGGAAAADPSEHLVVLPYPSDPPWKTTPDDEKTLAWIPADQVSQAASSDLLTAQTFTTLKGTDAGDFARGFAQSVAAVCTSVHASDPTIATENGFKVSYIQFYCMGFRKTALDVDCYMKVIGGNDALYVVQRIFRRASGAKADPVAEKTAGDFLTDKVRLCAPGDSDGVCATNAP